MFIQNALDTNITMITGSSMTVNDLLALNDVAMKARLSVDGAATFASSATAKGSVQLGDTPGTDEVAVNMATGDARATGALNVAGDTASGAFVAKFYSGADMAAWIKKK
jgi:hypothetical protein